jgi:linoleate 8R-lipoxygenase/9,12-octadecadienoate 8-hydroperoxide 8R-isomerase
MLAVCTSNSLSQSLFRSVNDKDSAAAFGARQTPVVLKLVSMLGISQARSWHVGTLNELRKFMDLTPHKSFQDINPDPEVQAAMKSLYKEPDFVELYPGVIFEEAKKPVYPGSGLCAGFTITRAILSDAVSLTRGDRFYTVVRNPIFFSRVHPLLGS